MEFKDYYKIMGVARDASQDEIKRVYRQLARKYHPDVSKSPDAEARFKELGEAYAVLKDLEKRAAYDQLGSNWKAGQDFRPPPDWNAGFEFSGDGSGGDFGGAAGDFSDFFEALYGRGFATGGRSRQAFSSRGEDHHAKVLIDLEDAYSGATRTITLQRPETDADGHLVMRGHKLNVTIPRGIRSGQHIRLSGQGAPGIGQGKPGDLYLEVGFNPHARYRVDQRDVYLDLPVAPWEAALGASVKVPTPNGVVELKVPPGSVAGGKLRLKGRGIPGSTPGDFYAVLHPVLPPADSETANAFYLYMAGQFPSFAPRAGLGV
ncbi:DnaJ C-terminal domain-containing protein [Propionivibrio sp.]|uniref:DnaJ C-terminal domain-containing protein n=1 Tax=Propionivibrio sp. TaxID=2212460 RepID=UPI00260835DA|nr:DnaJ C-terminal domain-containing protein [Propionivibrio sp.]